MSFNLFRVLRTNSGLWALMAEAGRHYLVFEIQISSVFGGSDGGFKLPEALEIIV